MSEELFDVVFFGILQPGKDKEAVMQNMASLFKTDAKKLAPYFAGGRKAIKEKINASAAEKYQAALENVGLVIKIEACETARQEDKQAETSTQQSQKQASETSIDTGNITVAPVGSDVIENPVDVPAQEIGDISDISLAEAGSNVLDHPQQVIPQKIDDISDITLAETGVDMIENPEPEKKADIPDTSELSLDNEKGQ